MLNGDPKTVSQAARLGLFDRRSDRQAGRQQQAVLLLQPGVRAADGGQRRACGSACRRRSSAQGDFSQTTDNNGNPYPYIRDASLSGDLRGGATRPACFADGGVLGRIPASRLYQTGLNILKHVPDAEHRSAAGLAYNYEITRPTETASGLAAGDPRRLPARRSRCARRSSTRGWRAAQAGHQRLDSRLQRHADAESRSSPRWRSTVNYTLTPTMFLEATYGHSQNELAGCALGAERPGRRSATSALPMNPIANREHAGLGGTADAVSGRASVINPGLLRATSVLERCEPPIWQDGQLLKTPNFTWGSRCHDQRAAEHRRSRASSTSTPPHDISISLTKVAGPAHDQGRLLQHAQLQGAAAGPDPFGHARRSRNDTDQPARLARSGSRTRRSASSARISRQSKYVEGDVRLQQHRGLHPGQLEGERAG